MSLFRTCHLPLFMFLCVISASAFAAEQTAQPPGAPAPPTAIDPEPGPPAHAPRGKPDEVKPERVIGHQGRPVSVIGHFNVGLDRSSVHKPDRVGLALRDFVHQDRRQFGLDQQDAVKLAVYKVDSVDAVTNVARVHQFVGDLRVMDADVTAVLTEDGALQSVNGRLVANRSPEARTNRTLEEILRVIEQERSAQGISAPGELDQFREAGPNVWRRQSDGASVEAGWSDAMGKPTWKATLPFGIVWIDDQTGKIVRRESHEDTAYDSRTRSCQVRHRDWPRAADGRATSLNEVTNSTLLENVTCGGDDWWGTCYWHLKRQPAGYSHPIARIQDANGSEQERRIACSSNTTPEFTATNGDALREQGAFYIANQMRFFINQNVWSQVAPNRQSNVDITLDLTGDSAPATASFNNFFTSIRANEAFGQQQVLMHEYGHYVVWTYDDVSGNCRPGIDEGDSLDETLANVFAELYAVDDGDINPRYGALNGFALNNGPPAHTNAASIITQNVTCATSNNPSDGRAFQQAIWELLFNRDCSATACATNSGPGNQIWTGQSQEAVIRHVGAALGFALRVLGQNITHSQVRAQMILKITLDSGTATANRARAVFTHHGI